VRFVSQFGGGVVDVACFIFELLIGFILNLIFGPPLEIVKRILFSFISDNERDFFLFLFATASRRALGPTQPPIKVTWALFRE
jgi:hypothetical protein